MKPVFLRTLVDVGRTGRGVIDARCVARGLRAFSAMSMKPNYVLQAWRENRQTLGGWLSLPSAPGAELMAHAGFDWLCIDLQHGLIDYKDLLGMLQGISTTNCVPFVRTTWNDTAEINKVLDAGAQGIIVPLVNTREDAERAVRAKKYAMSGGCRSIGPTRAGVVLGTDYVAKADNELALILQIETQEALDNVDAIVATPGVDAVYVGPSDLAMSMGNIPTGGSAQWQNAIFDDSGHRIAAARILEAARKHNKAAVMHMFAAPGEKADQLSQRLVGEGWNSVMLGSDRTWLSSGCAQALNAVRPEVPPVCPGRGAIDMAVLQHLADGKISVQDAATALAKGGMASQAGSKNTRSSSGIPSGIRSYSASSHPPAQDSRAKQAPGTVCIHAGAEKQDGGSILTPVYNSVATVWPNSKEQHIYPRYNKGPNVEVVAARVAALEGGEAACVFSSGMAAITSVLFTFLQTGDHCVMSEVYGATFELGAKDFPKRGIENTFVLTRRVEDFEEALRPETRLLYLETPSNPLISVLDLEAVIQVARKKCREDLIIAVDNTFSTPINTNPLSLGADVSIHSATKFLNGHSDLQAGVAVATREHIETIRQNVIMYGGGLNAQDAYMLERGLMTFDLRMRAHNSNGLRLAEFLESHPRVARVLYPGLPSHPGFEIAQRQMRGGGAMLAFDLGGGDTTGLTANRFLQALRLSTPARSLGGCHTTVCLPAETSHARLTEKERLEIGIGPGLVRVSVGIEEAGDILADFDTALNSL